MRHRRTQWFGCMVAWGVAAAGLFTLLLPGSLIAAPLHSTNPGDPLTVAQAFFTALNAQSAEQAAALVDPATRFLGDPGTPLAREHDLAGLLADAQAVNLRLTVTDLRQVGPETVVAQYMLTADDLPALPHPFTASATLTVRQGRITGWVSHLSAQTFHDLGGGALPPGMPRSGRPDWTGLGLLAGLGLGLVGGGRWLRRWTRTSG